MHTTCKYIYNIPFLGCKWIVLNASADSCPLFVGVGHALEVFDVELSPHSGQCSGYIFDVILVIQMCVIMLKK